MNKQFVITMSEDEMEDTIFRPYLLDYAKTLAKEVAEFEMDPYPVEPNHVSIRDYADQINSLKAVVNVYNQFTYPNEHIHYRDLVEEAGRKLEDMERDYE